MKDQQGFSGLQAEVRRVLAAALASEERHNADMQQRDESHHADTTRRDKLHLGEIERRDVIHSDEIERREDHHSLEMETIRAALDTRDVIGQAKGIIMSSLGCTPDEAFQLLTSQSQAENRKLIEIAIEIAQRTQRP